MSKPREPRADGEDSAGLETEAPTLDLAPTARVVAGRFRLESSLGRGAFGEVHRAWDLRLERPVALKLLTGASVDRGSSAVRRFEDEARTAARLDHPNVVPVYDAGVEDGVPWLAMRLVDGASLERLLRDQGPLASDRALALLRQVAAALGHAHRRGLVHRDVKPGNVMVERGDDGGERALLTDFGLARLQAVASTAVSVAGTPAYMAPEQVAGKRVDGRTDVFALGVLACELVGGERPFSGDAPAAVMWAVVHDPPALAAVERRAGAAYAAVLGRCLAKAPEDRFQTAEELLAALDTVAAGGAAAGRPRRRGFALLRWPRAAASPVWDGLHPLRTAALSKAYRARRPVLAGVDLAVPRGAVYALLGRNGCGKTTLLRTVLGLYRRDGGRVELFGRDPERHGSEVLGRVGYVPDSLALEPRLRVGEALDLGAALYPSWDKAYCYHLLERFELPLADRLRTLSRGMQTQLGLVLALAHRPELLVLDDAMVGLDAVVLDALVGTLEEASRQEGATILVASHNYDEVERLATHACLLKDARVTFSGPVEELKRKAREVRLLFPDDAPDLRGVPGFKVLHASGRRVTGVVLDGSAEALSRLEGLGAELTLRELNLREIFVSLLR